MLKKIRHNISKIWHIFIAFIWSEDRVPPMVSRAEATGITLAVLLIGLWVLFHTNYWWPGAVLVIWVALAVRQMLRSHWYELLVTTAVYLCLFLSIWAQVDWNFLVPVLLITAAFALFIRELLVFRPYTTSDAINDKKVEMEHEEKS